MPETRFSVCRALAAHSYVPSAQRGNALAFFSPGSCVGVMISTC
jgi:hypothetical protein